MARRRQPFGTYAPKAEAAPERFRREDFAGKSPAAAVHESLTPSENWENLQQYVLVSGSPVARWEHEEAERNAAGGDPYRARTIHSDAQPSVHLESCWQVLMKLVKPK